MLSYEELEILIDAMTAWEGQPKSSALSGGMLVTMMLLGTGGEKGEAEKAFKTVTEDGEKETEGRKNTTIMIKAKLSQMLKEITVDELTKSLEE